MHSMHGRQNFEAYWNFSLTFPEVLVLSFSPLSDPSSCYPMHVVPMRRNVPRTRLRDVPCTYFYRVSVSLLRSCDSSLPADT